nr:uncharacterized protein LOC110377296 [Helicoverpa armigera]
MWYMLHLAHFVVGLSLLVIVILSMCMICLENMRIGFRSSVGIFGTLFAFVIFSGAFFHMIYGYITSSKIFLTASATMFFVDIICIGVGCTAFDYTSYWMYAIVVVPGLAIYYPIYLGLPRLLSELFFPIDERLDPNDFTWTTILIVILLPATVAELHILLDEDAIELAEDDYMFGGYLLLICLIDFPIRFLRKKGFLGEKEERDDEE